MSGCRDIRTIASTPMRGRQEKAVEAEDLKGCGRPDNLPLLSGQAGACSGFRSIYQLSCTGAAANRPDACLREPDTEELHVRIGRRDSRNEETQAAQVLFFAHPTSTCASEADVKSIGLLRGLDVPA